MKNIIEEWSIFCEQEQIFQEGHFYTLFYDDLNYDDLKNIFKYFKNCDVLISKYLSFRKYSAEIKNKQDFDSKLEFLIISEFLERNKINEIEVVLIFN